MKLFGKIYIENKVMEEETKELYLQYARLDLLQCLEVVKELPEDGTSERLRRKIEDAMKNISILLSQH